MFIDQVAPLLIWSLCSDRFTFWKNIYTWDKLSTWFNANIKIATAQHCWNAINVKWRLSEKWNANQTNGIITVHQDDRKYVKSLAMWKFGYCRVRLCQAYRSLTADCQCVLWLLNFGIQTVAGIEKEWATISAEPTHHCVGYCSGTYSYTVHYTTKN